MAGRSLGGIGPAPMRVGCLGVLGKGQRASSVQEGWGNHDGAAVRWCQAEPHRAANRKSGLRIVPLGGNAGTRRTPPPWGVTVANHCHGGTCGRHGWYCGIPIKTSLIAWAFWRLVWGTRGIAGCLARRLRGLWLKQWSWPRRASARHGSPRSLKKRQGRGSKVWGWCPAQKGWPGRVRQVQRWPSSRAVQKRGMGESPGNGKGRLLGDPFVMSAGQNFPCS